MSETPAQASVPKTLAGKLLMASEIIGKIEKSGTNSHFRFSYQTWDDVVVAVRDACLATKIALVPSAVLLDSSTDKVCNVQLSVVITDAESGETQTATWIGQSATDQFAFQKALSSAYKYFLLKTFLIPTKDDVDQAGDPDGDGRARSDSPRNSHVDQAGDRPRPQAQRSAPKGGDRKIPTVFGFTPEREPFMKAFGEQASESQIRALAKRAAGYPVAIGENAIPWLLLALTLALGRKDAEFASKGAHSFAMDFLAQVPPDSVTAALKDAIRLKNERGTLP